MSGEKKTILAKMRFIEHIVARRDLTDLQRRVAIRLVSLFNVKRGYAYPSYDGLADDLGASRRKVIDAVNKLVELGLFVIVRRGGRGHANEYAPTWDAVPDGCPFAAKRVTAAAPFKGPDGWGKNAKCIWHDAERVTLAAIKGDHGGINSDRSVTSSGLYTSDLSFIRPAQNAAASSPEGLTRPISASPSEGWPDLPDGYCYGPVVDERKVLRFPWRKKPQGRSNFRLSPDERAALGELQGWERRIKAGALADLSQELKLELREKFDNLSVDYERHEGHPVGGLAFRLSMLVEEAMDYDEDGVPLWPGEAVEASR